MTDKSKIDLSIIIAHYFQNLTLENPLIKIISIIEKQNFNNIEIIIADDGSNYTKKYISKNYEMINKSREVYFFEDDGLKKILIDNNIKSTRIKRWIYLPKEVKCMSKARVGNIAAKSASSKNLLFLDDDNYFISNDSICNLLKLFKNYHFIVGQIKDKDGRLRNYNSHRVQGTTIAIKKDIFLKIKGFGEWTEEFSCGVDSDFWIRVFNHFSENKKLKACFTNKISTFDSYSKRWKKYTKMFKEILIRIEFYQRYKCINYKSPIFNQSRNKKLWIQNLTNEKFK